MGTKSKHFILNEKTGNLHPANEIQNVLSCKCSQIVQVHVGIQIATIGAADIDNVTPATCLCYAPDVTHENDTQENTVMPKNATHDNNVTHENCTQEDDVTPEKSTHENVTGDNCPMKSDRGTEENGTSSNNGIVNKPLTFKDTCKEDLLNEGLMTKLVDKLHANNRLQDFVNLVKLLANGIMSPMIIAFLLCLDVAHLLSCTTTTQMRF